ncbi:hypothetical protein S245_033208 [Arachis hypogaea]|nr:Pentatricopeptide repeat-containing protein [Arachis hypogaea]
MQCARIEEGRDMLLSILRASMREGDAVKEEKAWLKFLRSKSNPPPPQTSQATVYKMEVYSKVGMLCKSLDLMREMQGQLIARHDEAHTKITEILVQILRNRTCW